MNHLYIYPLGLLLAAALAACDQGEPEADDAGMDSPPEVEHPLGPGPGTAEAPPPADNPYRDDAAALQEGRKLFVAYNCYGCHGGYGGGGMAPSLRDATWLYGNKAEDIFNSISQGRPHAMPAWGTMLPEDQIWKLTAYIQSMGTEREPKRPK